MKSYWDKSEEIVLKVGEKYKAKLLYYALLDQKNLVEWIKGVLDKEIQRREQESVE